MLPLDRVLMFWYNMARNSLFGPCYFERFFISGTQEKGGSRTGEKDIMFEVTIIIWLFVCLISLLAFGELELSDGKEKDAIKYELASIALILALIIITNIGLNHKAINTVMACTIYSISIFLELLSLAAAIYLVAKATKKPTGA